MAEEYIRENYPEIHALASLIEEMPVMHEFESEWARTEASRADPWDLVAGDIDSISTSPSEEDRLVFELLLDYMNTPTRKTLKELLKKDLKEWTELFIYVSYVLLSDVNATPLLLKSHHPAADPILVANQECITYYLIGRRKYEKAGKSMPQCPQIVWEIDDLTDAVDDEDFAEYLYAILVKTKRWPYKTMRIQNIFISAAAFDNGDRLEWVLIVMARKGDEKRLQKWLEEVKEPLVTHRNVVSVIISSGPPGVLSTLLERYRDNDKFSKLIVRCLIGSNIKLEAFKTLNSFFTYDDLIALLQSEGRDIWVVMANAIAFDNVELVDELLRIGASIDTLITKGSYKISYLEYALRVNAEKTIEYLLPLFIVNPYQALVSLMYDRIDEDTSKGISILLNHYQYSDEELLEALHHSNSLDKMKAVIKRLHPEFVPRETKSDISRAFIPR